LEVAVGAQRLADNNFCWKNKKQAFSTKNRVVVLSGHRLKFGFMVEEKTVRTWDAFFLLSDTSVDGFGRRRETLNSFKNYLPFFFQTHASVSPADSFQFCKVSSSAFLGNDEVTPETRTNQIFS